jgi:hypothetical protein
MCHREIHVTASREDQRGEAAYGEEFSLDWW